MSRGWWPAAALCACAVLAAEPARAQSREPPKFQSVSAGEQHTCALDRSGVIYCWGDANGGAAGSARGEPCGVAHSCVRRPVAVTGDGFTMVSAGSDHTCALLRDGKAWCTGGNRHGALGNGSRERGLTLAPAGGALVFQTIAAGSEFTCAIATGGVAYCWGRGNDGQLGRAVRADTALPVAVETSVHFTAIAAGSGFGCGVGADSLAYCWGRGREGQLGTDTTLDSPVPVLVVGGHRFVAITTGADHACAIATDSLAYCWGKGGDGQLGTAERRDSRHPVAVTGGIRFVSLSAGKQFTCGVGANGSAYCWGPERSSRIGGSSAERDGRRPVNTVTEFDPLRFPFRTVAAGSTHVCGVVADWSVWCWGEGDAGQLGNPGAVVAYAPIPVVRP